MPLRIHLRHDHYFFRTGSAIRYIREIRVLNNNKDLCVTNQKLRTMYTDNDFIRLDWAAKHILRDKEDFEVFEGLMTVLFGEPVKIIELLESESNKRNKDDKSNRVDIKAKNSKDEIILVEIQVEPGSHYMQRILFGVSKAITEHIVMGQDYSKVKKVYSINILYYNFGYGADYLYHGTNQFKGVHTGDTLEMCASRYREIRGKHDSDVFPEYYILRVTKYDKEVATTPLEEWMQYLKEGRIRPDTKAPGLQKAREKLRVLSMTDEERQEYEKFLSDKWYERDILEYHEEQSFNQGYDQGEAIGLERGKAIGLAEGEAKAMRELAMKMKADGMDDETVFRLTGLRPS